MLGFEMPRCMFFPYNALRLEKKKASAKALAKALSKALVYFRAATCCRFLAAPVPP